MTTCGLPPTYGCPSTTTPPNATSAWSRSSRKSPGACAPSPAPRTSPRCAPTWPPRPSTATSPSTSSPNSPTEMSGSPRRPEQSRRAGPWSLRLPDSQKLVEFGADRVGAGVVQVLEDAPGLLPGVPGTLLGAAGVMGVAEQGEEVGIAGRVQPPP